jgi:tRNA(adenine34) deaminase
MNLVRSRVAICLVYTSVCLVPLQAWHFLQKQLRPWRNNHDDVGLSRRRGRRVLFPADTSATEVHSYFMQLALDQARIASRRYNEVPVGSLVVHNRTREQSLAATSSPRRQSFRWARSLDESTETVSQVYEILAACGNRVESTHDASAHAELLALRKAGRRRGNWRLPSGETILYATLEPCPLCWAATHAFRVAYLVYGARDARLGAVVVVMAARTTNSTTEQQHIASPMAAATWSHPFHTITSITAGVGANESSQLLRAFFQHRRRRTKESAPPRATTTKAGDTAVAPDTKKAPT